MEAVRARDSDGEAHGGYRSANLDVLRAVAMTLVLVGHGVETWGRASFRYFHFVAFGFPGVLGFFVHTTFVLMLSLERRYDEQGRAAFGFFLIRRFLRIYPLSVAAVFASWWIAVTDVGAPPPLHTKALVAELALVQNFTHSPSSPGPLWTLPYETQMYLVFPAMFLLARWRTWPWVLAWAALAGAVVVLSRLGVNVDVIQYAACFLPGVMAYIRRHVRPTLPWFVLPTALLACALAYGTLAACGVPEDVLAPVTALFIGLLLPRVKEVPIAALVRVANVISTRSYSIYLAQAELFLLVERHGAGFPLPVRIATFLVALVVVSSLAYRAIEEPSMRLGARIGKGKQSKIQSSTDAPA